MSIRRTQVDFSYSHYGHQLSVITQQDEGERELTVVVEIDDKVIRLRPSEAEAVSQVLARAAVGERV